MSWILSGFGCPPRLIMTCGNFQLAIFSVTIDLQHRKKKISLSPLLIATLIATKAPPTLFLYRFFFFSSLTIGNISSSFFSRMVMAAIFLLKRAGDFFSAYRKSFFGTQISSCQSTLCISKARDLMERHRNSPILLTL